MRRLELAMMITIVPIGLRLQRHRPPPCFYEVEALRLSISNDGRRLIHIYRVDGPCTGGLIRDRDVISDRLDVS